MKNSLFALLWAIVLVPASAQKTLPQSMQPYFENLNPKAVSALTKAGFDLAANPSAVDKPGAPMRSNALQLDSTKTYFGYDFVGTDDTLPLYRTIYQYPQPDIEFEYEYQYDMDAWQTVSRSKTSKDNLGREVEVFSEEFDAAINDFKPNSKLVVFPHSNSLVLIDSFQVYGWDTVAVDWLLLFYSKNLYDAQDRLVESINSFDYFGQALLLKDVYTYDANGDNTLVESFALFGGLEIPSGKREMEYQNHLLTEAIAFSDDGMGGLIAQNKTTYTYTSFDKQEQVNTYSWSLAANDWKQTQGNLYGYDSAQRVNAQENVIYAEDGSEERNLSKYDYVEDDQLNSEANYYWSVSNYYLSDRIFYYYSDGTLSDKEPIHPGLKLDISPNPTSGVVRLNLEAPAMIRIYNTQGEMVSSGEYQPNYTLHVSDLPSGLYFISARTENEQYVGRLIKE